MNQWCLLKITDHLENEALVFYAHSIQNRTDCIMTLEADLDRVMAKMSDELSEASTQWT